MKKCKKCGEYKDLINFNKLKISKDGLRTQCKDCEREYRIKNRDKMKKYLNNYYKENKYDLLEKYKEKYESNKEEINEKRRDRYNTDQELRYKISNAGRKYRKNNSDKVKISKRRYYEDNKDYIRNWKKKYYESIKDIPEHKEKHRKDIYNWSRKNPHIVAWRNSLRRVLYYFNIKKSESTIDILGYSAKEFRDNIEGKFSEGMSWENWGEWHIDHIIPVSKFDKETPPSIVNSLSNLQPLWAIDNYKKSNN
jgi:hypothetical protein